MRKVFGSFLIAFVLMIGIIIGGASVLVGRVWKVRSQPQPTFSPQPLDYKYQPPAKAIPTEVLELNGTAKKELLNSTESAELKVGDAILPGETTTVGDNSEIQVTSKNKMFIITGSEKSIFTISNGLATSFLVKQDFGEVGYATTPGGYSFSIRSLHLLTNLNDNFAEVKMKMDDRSKNLDIRLLTGSAKFGWEDNDLKTGYKEVTAPYHAVWNDQAKTLKEVK